MSSRDAPIVHAHAVAAPEILDGDARRLDPQTRMPARDRGVVDREMALRAPPDDELASRHLEMARLVAQAVAGHELDKITIPTAASSTSRRKAQCSSHPYAKRAAPEGTARLDELVSDALYSKGTKS